MQTRMALTVKAPDSDQAHPQGRLDEITQYARGEGPNKEKRLQVLAASMTDVR